MSITRETLLAALRPVIVAETVAPFGDIRIRQLPVTEVEDLREASNKDNKQFCHRLLIASVAGDDDRPLLTPAERRLVVVEWNATQAGPRDERCRR